MIEIRPYALPLATPYRWSKGEQTTRGGLIHRIEISGHVGWGETAPPPHVPVDGPALQREAEAAVAGLDPEDDNFLERLDTRAPATRIRTGISTAWFCARAATAGMPLAAYLGQGWREPAAQVPINGLIGEGDPDAAAGRAREIWQQGIRTFKIKCTEDHDLDDRRVAAIRAAFPSATLRLDPNEAWTRANMLNRMAAMAPLDIAYVEEPVSSAETMADLAGFAALKRASPIPVALDQSVKGVGEATAILDAGAADVLIMKSQAVGGFDRAMDVVRLAEDRGVVCVMTSSLESAVGLTASLHAAALLGAPIPACGLSLGRFFTQDVAAKPPIVNGVMKTPTAPGLGLENVVLD